MFAIDFEAVIGVGNDYLYAMSDMYRERVALGYRKGDIYDGMCKVFPTDEERELNALCERFYKCQQTLYTVADVTGIRWDVIIQAARIYNDHGERCGWQRCLSRKECEDPYQVLTE